jgi:hypothetical protein
MTLKDITINTSLPLIFTYAGIWQKINTKYSLIQSDSNLTLIIVVKL